VIWRIERNGGKAGNAHVSETGQLDILPDLIIENGMNGQSALRQSVEAALQG
jgi:hypothetical protein